MIIIENKEYTRGNWVFSPEEIVKIQNRMNDLWEADPSDIDEYVAAANRLIGVLDAYITPNHFVGVNGCNICNGCGEEDDD